MQIIYYATKIRINENKSKKISNFSVVCGESYGSLRLKRAEFDQVQTIILFQRDILHLFHILVEEELGMFAEGIGVLGGEITTGGVLRTACFELGMALQIVLQAVGHILTLWDDSDAWVGVFDDLGHEQRIMGAAQDDGIDLGIKTHQLIDALLHEIIGPGTVCLVGLDDGCPKRTGNA